MFQFCCSNREGASSDEPPFANVKEDELSHLNGNGRKATPRVGSRPPSDREVPERVEALRSLPRDEQIVRLAEIPDAAAREATINR